MGATTLRVRGHPTLGLPRSSNVLSHEVILTYYNKSSQERKRDNHAWDVQTAPPRCLFTIAVGIRDGSILTLPPTNYQARVSQELF